MMSRRRKGKRLLFITVVVGAAMALAAPAIASAECTAIVSHTAAVYENSNGTGFIENKFIGEGVRGPEAFSEWINGASSPWVDVWRGAPGKSIGYMDINEIATSNTCNNPW